MNESYINNFLWENIKICEKKVFIKKFKFFCAPVTHESRDRHFQVGRHVIFGCL